MIICYGSINPDFVHHVDRLPGLGDDLPAERFELTFGGGAANVAVLLAGWGAEAAVLGHTLGTDPLADWLLLELQQRGVDTSAVIRDSSSRTPHTTVLVTPDGERTIIGSRYAGVTWSKPSEQLLAEATTVVVDGYSGTAGGSVASMSHDVGVPVVGVDVAPETAPSCQIVVWSKHEHAAVHAAGHPALVITDGPRPVTVITPRRTWRIAPPHVHVKNATGACDAFAAMCALGTARRWHLEETMSRAVAAGTLVASVARGSQPPSLTEISAQAETLLKLSGPG